MLIRRCRDDERAAILTIINAAARAYCGVIPGDLYHDPYMLPEEFERAIDAGVQFWCVEHDGVLIGIMGLQEVRDVDLIRHAYVLPGHQRVGLGAALITHLMQASTRPVLVGTWAAATWAIDFYRRHGFALVSAGRKTALLRQYWDVSERQIETSVVLANVARCDRAPVD
jgi:N-acetylglutamate synthase-like GNAT family acetyltransferase